MGAGRLPRIEGVDEASCLHQAEGLIDLGMAPVELAKELGLDLNLPRVSKTYNQNELRNPKDEGHASGEWTKDPVASGSIAFAPSPIEAPPIEPPPQTSPLAPQGQTPTSALAPAAPSLVDALGVEALAWLRLAVGRLAPPVSLFGAVFVPSANEGTSEQGSVPGRPGMSYSLDRDTGTLRLSLDSDRDPDHALVAHLGSDGIYRDVDTNVPIARALGSSAVIIDLDRAPYLAEAPNEEGETTTTTSRSSAPIRRRIRAAAVNCSIFFTNSGCAITSILSENRSSLPGSPLPCHQTPSPAGCIMTIAARRQWHDRSERQLCRNAIIILRAGVARKRLDQASQRPNQRS